MDVLAIGIDFLWWRGPHSLMSLLAMFTGGLLVHTGLPAIIGKHYKALIFTESMAKFDFSKSIFAKTV